MLTWETELYLLKKETGFSGTISEKDFFLVFIVEEGITAEEGNRFLTDLKDSLPQENFNKLSLFESFLTKKIQENNLPAGFSLSSAYFKNGILYLKTINKGRVYLKRKNQFQLLISSSQGASGYPEVKDYFILTTQEIKEETDLGELPLALTAKLIEEDVFEDKKIIDEAQKELIKKKSIFDNLKELYLQVGKKRNITFITVFLILIIFLWSVVLGYQRRKTSQANEKVKLTKELISQKLSSAEEVAFLNLPRALVLLKESKQEVADLKKDYPQRKEILELEEVIKKFEGKILKKEEVKYSEFFDLAVDDKKAQGTKLYLEGNSLLILDKNNGVLFNLSLEKKSLNKEQKSDLKNANLIASYEDKKYFYIKDRGVYLINDSKVTKILEKDKNWGEVVDMAVYNGNLYLLDKGKDEVWKYLNVEDGFGSGTSYFQSGQAIDLSVINSLAIDGSIYLAGDSVIVKYTSGLRDGFKVDLPDKDFSFNKVFTSKSLEKVYLWDRRKGDVYILGKTGEYVEQVSSEILGKGSDMVVYKNSIYVLEGSKIYKID
ncbi:hypothetical protein COY88_00540 [Candidatus Roizmanbacteria bacterium CG_4_10_14_0_8_um_filter_35_28]|uniref:Uncharacterized protein n=1 Tax=Candidatus Roizmanbacteria bacterium CG_4_10_14_0_8_um_filter_35_28 TaxID=1974827 RepID=A0A2M7QGG0_9BACT|nr:MAG: hypothetical protein COY88_00540 [Candidatus Roizmanbacteria bacterium CG_4_10_14_0_8_um_filter_35_28]PJC82674.1 MAG: hypothetical protein CO006_02420 [Candidatus Roizmanbacteria bacterium CG_4_8_14_3_um_filter_35_14]